ncbi:hypothetical protein OIU78_004532 [Salix suchowensis]|nr:hypothetical protein OIU78_004532 [Salix suchowensis]
MVFMTSPYAYSVLIFPFSKLGLINIQYDKISYQQNLSNQAAASEYDHGTNPKKNFWPNPVSFNCESWSIGLRHQDSAQNAAIALIHCCQSRQTLERHTLSAIKEWQVRLVLHGLRSGGLCCSLTWGMSYGLWIELWFYSNGITESALRRKNIRPREGLQSFVVLCSRFRSLSIEYSTGNCIKDFALIFS